MCVLVLEKDPGRAWQMAGQPWVQCLAILVLAIGLGGEVHFRKVSVPIIQTDDRLNMGNETLQCLLFVYMNRKLYNIGA